jgi:hypothetical protein
MGLSTSTDLNLRIMITEDMDMMALPTKITMGTGVADWKSESILTPNPEAEQWEMGKWMSARCVSRRACAQRDRSHHNLIVVLREIARPIVIRTLPTRKTSSMGDKGTKGKVRVGVEVGPEGPVYLPPLQAAPRAMVTTITPAPVALALALVPAAVGTGAEHDIKPRTKEW